MTAYYNEVDPYAAEWLRNLIRDGHIAPGDVDERSIEDVQPDDLRPYTQCHFFAGVGLWSLALRLAGWDDDKPIWTGSCPCQPFSTTGKGGGFADERHLWPALFHLITQCRPEIVCGEQVAKKSGLLWGDLVQTDLEGLGDSVWRVVFGSAGIGAPHGRERQYWVSLANPGRSDTNGAGVHGEGGRGRPADGSPMDDAERPGPQRHAGDGGATAGREEPGRSAPAPSLSMRSDALKGFWRDPDWILCEDNKWRPVEPESSPLAHGLPRSLGTVGPGLRQLYDAAGVSADTLRDAKRYRVGSLRGYGNAINPEQAAAFIRAWNRN